MVQSANREEARELAELLNIRPASWMTVAAEVPVYGLIPDLLFATADQQPAWCENAAISVIQAHVLAHLVQRGTSSLQELAEELFISDSGARRALTSMAKDGLVDQVDDCFMPRVSSSEMFLIAVEFKLKRWREALNQAISYFDFANQSYVVLDGEQVSNYESFLSEFRAAGVGLVLQTKSRMRLVLQSDTKFPITAARVRAYQQIAAYGFKSKLQHASPKY